MNEPDPSAALLRVLVGSPVVARPEARTWSEWESLAARERVWPLLYQIVERMPTDLSDQQRLTIQLRQEVAQSRCVTLEHHLIAVTGRLERAGIRSAVLKGAAVAHLDYPDPAWRDFADVDLLIEPQHMAHATELLTGDGWTQRYALPKGHERYAHALTFERSGAELDLHQRLGHRAIGLRVPTGALLDRSESFEIADARLSALDVLDRLIHAALHAVTSRMPNRRLSSVADVLLLAQTTESSAGEVLERAEEWRVRTLVERGVTEAYGAARLDLGSGWSEAMSRPVRLRDRLVDRAYLSSHRRPVIEELAYLRLLPSWRERWRYSTGYLSTDAAYRAQHGRSSILAQARYLVAKLRSKA